MPPGEPVEVEIREMGVEDIAEVFHLGNQLFHGPEFTTLYRTWDAYEVTTNFNQDPELSLVAEAGDGKIVGFALGTTYAKERSPWKYGLVSWLGVRPEYQGKHIGERLYREMERLMREQGVRMVMVDTAAENAPAIGFFEHMGFGKPQYEVWLSKVIPPTQRK